LTSFAALTRARFRPAEEDFREEATLRDRPALDAILEELRRRAPLGPGARMADLGCGLGGLTLYVAASVGIDDVLGVDVSEPLLRRAAERGVRTALVDLATQRLPLSDGSVDLVTTFGLLEHLPLFDNAIEEAFRVLKPGGHLLLSAPNLGSYLNRLALLLGFQPHVVEVSTLATAGTLPGYRPVSWRKGGAAFEAGSLHMHSGTLRCLRELLEHHGFSVLSAHPLSPRSRSRLLRVMDATLGRAPSLSRRYLLLARRPTESPR
jgi:SAM-dependent methyltransferase